MNLRRPLAFLLLAWLLPANLPATRADGPNRATLTVLKNRAYVVESRTLDLPLGTATTSLRGLPRTLMPETLLLDLSGTGVELRSYRYDGRLLTPEALANAFVGRSVRFVRADAKGGDGAEVAATLLSVQQGIVLEIGGHIEVNPPGRIVYPMVPAELQAEPRIELETVAKTADTRRVALSYLAGGFSWEANYAAQLDASGNRMRLVGYASVYNRTGVDFARARLRLLAGEVHEMQRFPKPVATPRLAMSDEVKQAGVPESKEGYYLYNVPGEVDLYHGQVGQFRLFDTPAIPVRRRYELDLASPSLPWQHSQTEQRHAVMMVVEWTNLEKALPAGVVRVYAGETPAATFLGEDQIPHTPQGENVRVTLGNAFDVTAEKTQTAFRRLPASRDGRYVWEASYKAVFYNATKTKIELLVRERFPGEWQILEESLDHQQESAEQVLWRVNVPGEGKAQLTYRIRVVQ